MGTCLVYSSIVGCQYRLQHVWVIPTNLSELHPLPDLAIWWPQCQWNPMSIPDMRNMIL